MEAAGIGCAAWSRSSRSEGWRLWPDIRGAVGTITQLAITIGILVAQVLSMSTVLGSVAHWRLLLGFSLLPAGIQSLALLALPESPAWLVAHRKLEQAQGVSDCNCHSCERPVQ